MTIFRQLGMYSFQQIPMYDFQQIRMYIFFFLKREDFTSAHPYDSIKITLCLVMMITKCSADTALRDIKVLIEKGILKQEESGGRSTNYELTI